MKLLHVRKEHSHRTYFIKTQKILQWLTGRRSGDGSAQDQKFSDVAREFSDDPSAKTNGGDLGWITAFTLPYALENLAYATPVGKYNLYRSKAGYHIFKNLEERKTWAA